MDSNKGEEMYTKTEHNYILSWSKRIICLDNFNWECNRCKKKVDIYDFDFHHIDPNEKEFEINRLRNFCIEKILKELDKCILVCSDCHNKIHEEENGISDRLERARNLLYSIRGIEHCEECGIEKVGNNLCFHHIDQSEKEFKISRLLLKLRKRGLQLEDVQSEIIEEVEKCEVLCHNCHRKRHFDFEKFDKYKDEIYKRVKTHKPSKKPLDKELVIEEYNNGLRIIDIAKKYDRNKSVIHGILKRNKIIP
jgi:hypothetical protein